jgi:hypothetical protein
MQITLDVFRTEVNQLHQSIVDYYRKKESTNQKLITDGVVDVGEYYNAPIRILWMLKEPYCDKLDGGGLWSMTDGLNVRASGTKKDSQGTWHPIIYSTWGILNNFMPYEEMPKIDSYPQLNAVLKQIAFVNVQKMPAGTRTNNRDIQEAFKENKELLLQQIHTYRPHIVIGGNTLHLFKKCLNIGPEDELSFGHFTKDRRLYINTMHPAQTKISRAEYVNKIIQRAKDWKALYS